MRKITFSDRALQQWNNLPEGPVKNTLRHAITDIKTGTTTGTLITGDSHIHYRATTVLVEYNEYMILWKEEGWNPVIINIIDVGTRRTYPGAYYTSETNT